MKIEFTDQEGDRHVITYKCWVWYDTHEGGSYSFTKYLNSRYSLNRLIKRHVPVKLQPKARLLLRLEKPTVLQRKILGLDNDV